MTLRRLPVVLCAGSLLAFALYVTLCVLCARREVDALRPGLAELSWERISYRSSVDGTAPLHALAIWRRGQGRSRLMVLMHGYTESAADYFSAGCHFARRGWLVLVPDMRGRTSILRYPEERVAERRVLGLHLPLWRTLVRLGTSPLALDHFTSAGRPDSGGIEVMDIHDAVSAARVRFARRLLPGTDIVGYSGGGTSALLAAIRVPLSFERVVAFFPIADFAAQHTHLSRRGRGPLAELRAWIGGDPRDVPYRYAARELRRGMGNLRHTRVLILADEEDEICPAPFTRALAHAARAVPSVKVMISGPGDAPRWLHEAPVEGSPLHEAERLFPAPATDGPDRGQEQTWAVLGYLITPDLEVRLGDLQQGVARCRVVRLADGARVELQPVAVPEGLRARVRVRIDGRWIERDHLPVRGSLDFSP